MSNNPAPTQDSDPVWVLASYRAGENSQLTALAEALGLPYQVKTIAYRPSAGRLGLLRRITLDGIDTENSSPLRAPWPRLVITSGLRNEPAARWIRGHSRTTRLVFIGRSWAPVDAFDLLVTTPQYRVPDHPKVLHNDTTLQAVTAARLQRAADAAKATLGDLPGPRIAVLIGGDSGPHRFGPRAAAALAERCNRLAASLGGSLLVSTSARTPDDAVRMLRETLHGPHQFYAWQARDPANPYFGYLGSADHIVVTSDSIAMLSEACATGKPVDIFDLSGHYPLGATPRFRPDWNLKTLAYRAMMHGPKRLTRDLDLVHQRLIAAGRAQWLGDPVNRPAAEPLGDVERTVARVRALL